MILSLNIRDQNICLCDFCNLVFITYSRKAYYMA